jgi:hypothetical protein
MLKLGVMYGCETWSMTVKDKVMLNSWERNILERAFEPLTRNGGNYIPFLI